jgi:hypothetical protein
LLYIGFDFGEIPRQVLLSAFLVSPQSSILEMSHQASLGAPKNLQNTDVAVHLLEKCRVSLPLQMTIQ